MYKPVVNDLAFTVLRLKKYDIYVNRKKSLLLKEAIFITVKPLYIALTYSGCPLKCRANAASAKKCSHVGALAEL